MNKYFYVFGFICFFVGSAIAANNQIPFKHDSSQIVEIISDNLEVLQKEGRAIFTGNVKAVQGELEMKSNKMVIYYDNSTNMLGKTDTQVSKVKAFGDVMLKTPEQEASGNEAVFDTVKKTIILMGKVSLSDGKNVVKGDNLIYDMKTGKGKIYSGNINLDSDSSKKKNRVKAVFTPES